MKIPVIHTYHTMYEDYLHYIAKGKLSVHHMLNSFQECLQIIRQVLFVPVNVIENYGIME